MTRTHRTRHQRDVDPRRSAGCIQSPHLLRVRLTSTTLVHAHTNDGGNDLTTTSRGLNRTNGNSNGLGLCCSGGRRTKKSEGILRVMPRAPAIKYQGILYPHGVEARVKEFLKRNPSVADKRLVRFQDDANAADHSESSMSALSECSEPVFGASQKAVN